MRLHAKEFRSLAGEPGDKRIEGLFIRFSLLSIPMPMIRAELPLLSRRPPASRHAFRRRKTQRRRRRRALLRLRSCSSSSIMAASKSRRAHRVRAAIGNHKGSQPSRTKLSLDMSRPSPLRSAPLQWIVAPKKIVQEQIAVGDGRRAPPSARWHESPKRCRSAAV